MASPATKNILETLAILGMLALPVGFLISTVMAVLQTDGPRRRISALILGLVIAFLSLMFVVIVFDNQFHYRLENMLYVTAAVLAIIAIFCAYLAHTYWPTQLRAVNLPATIGMAGTCLSLMLLFLSEM